MYKKDYKRLTAGSRLLLLFTKAAFYHGLLMDMGIMRKAVYPEYNYYYAKKRYDRLIYSLKRKGWISYEYKEGKKLLKLTKRGELETLLLKAKVQFTRGKWDGKWQLVMFDIPERTRDIRHSLRLLLKQLGFKTLQASVYISPWTINEDGIEYLKRSGLIRYIRIMRIDRADDEIGLKKTFKL